MDNHVAIELITSSKDGVTVSCPEKSMQQRYIKKGCVKCSYFHGVSLLTDAVEVDVKDRLTGEVTGKRPIYWHEKYLVKCAYPMTRRLANMSIVEE